MSARPGPEASPVRPLSRSLTIWFAARARVLLHVRLPVRRDRHRRIPTGGTPFSGTRPMEGARASPRFPETRTRHLGGTGAPAR